MHARSTRHSLAGASALLAATVFFGVRAQGQAPSAEPQRQPAEDTVAAGAKVYADTCGRCHNPRSPLEYDDRGWATIIGHMRVRGNLTGGQAREVLAFLQATNGMPSVAAAPSDAADATLQFSNAVSADPQIIAQGQAFVSQKACLGCHVIGSQGGQLGPSLNGVVKQRGVALVRHKLANPLFNNPRTTMPNFALTSEQIDAIVAYLNTLTARH